MLLDEPFTAIDAHTMADLITVIQLWHGEGRTVIVVLHDLDTVHSYFPDTLLLARKLVDHGPTKRVLTAENQFRARQMCEARLGSPHVCSRIPACAIWNIGRALYGVWFHATRAACAALRSPLGRHR